MDPNWSFHNSDHHNQPLFLNTTDPQYNNQQKPKNSNLLQQQLRSFWERQHLESEQAVDFRNHSLPLARIKKIMKSDDNVHMISSDAPVLLAKACDLFIQDLTLRSWSCTEETKRKTVQKSDISAALSTTDLFDFLVDIVPREKPLTSISIPMNPSRGFPMENGGPSVSENEGLMLGLQGDQIDQVVQGWPSYLSHQPAWPPPEF